ncbi:DNA repair protein RAD50 [Exophiala aquamarina CBS 119918]|uniref:Efflux pump dotC n=1 Tax=Exophiala aquamarina CBS 119918 TaxID=1182545 RepID=A0A072PIU7_9EURO|nr:DNA repair protein RAD50 [Exophiala aquamarina CBS 119918]KEF60059.1 DNA repair protein RAD50 [Exophiala aquamarina CBS 119918]
MVDEEKKSQTVADGLPRTGADTQPEPPSIHSHGSSLGKQPSHEGGSPSPVSSTDDVPVGGPPDGPALEKTSSRADAFSKARIGIIMFSLGMALFLAALDVTIITTALPTIAQHFNASAADYTWVGSSYLLANAASVPLWGKLSDIWGRKPMIIMANVIFMAGSLIAAVSNSIGLLIGGRVIQGIGGGGLVILVNICVADLFSMRDRPKYYGMLGMVWAIASGVGPVVGGGFTEGVSWRWCFYINLPLDGLSLVLLVFFLKLDTPKTPFIAGIKAIDWVGVILIVGGVTMFLFGMESGGVTHPWDSAYTLCLIIVGIFTIVLFFINEAKFAKYPVIPLRIFNDRSNLAALGVCFIHGFVFIAGSYYLPIYFQTVLSASPLLSGVYLFPTVLSLSFASAVTGIVVKKTGRYRQPIWFGLVMMTLGFGLFIDLGPRANWAKIVIYQIIAGIGVGPNFQSPLIALQSHVKGHDIAVATATFGFIRNISTSVSVVLGGVIMSNELSKKQSYLSQYLPVDVAQRLAASSFGSTTDFVKSLPPEQKQAVNVAYTESLKTMWIFYTAFAAFGILISLFITRKELSSKHEKARTGIAEQERVRLEEKEAKRARRNPQDTEANADAS